MKSNEANQSVRIEKVDGCFRLTAEQWLDASIDRVFPFFSDAFNLERITPSFLKFEVTTPRPIEMNEGALIDYRLKVRGMPMRWRSRIAVWNPPHEFVDEQVKGPYLQWYHRHQFEAHGERTLVRDVVDYRVPGGALVHALVVKRDVKQIFEHRGKVLAEMFGSVDAAKRDGGDAVDVAGGQAA